MGKDLFQDKKDTDNAQARDCCIDIVLYKFMNTPEAEDINFSDGMKKILLAFFQLKT